MRVVRLVASFCSVACLQACAVWPPGKDPAGQEQIACANEVLSALQRYQQNEGTLPASLADLAPKYIAALPRKPEIWYSPKTGALNFHYSPTLGWGQCVCAATSEDKSFACGFCYL